MASNAGLSPRVRGNPPLAWRSAVASRSIPACAGEPQSLRPPAAAAPVYPRVCGGTVRIWPLPVMLKGLSPRVRGNPLTTGVRASGNRSIPACAGEPTTSWGSVS